MERWCCGLRWVLCGEAGVAVEVAEDLLGLEGFAGSLSYPCVGVVVVLDVRGVRRGLLYVDVAGYGGDEVDAVVLPEVAEGEGVVEARVGVDDEVFVLHV